MELNKLTVEELFKLISPNSDIRQELTNRNVIKTKNLVGEIGLYYVNHLYETTSYLPNLILQPPSSKNINFVTKTDNIKYAVKTVTSKKGTTGSFWGPEQIEKNIKSFDFLLIVILDNDYQLELVLELTWNDFFKFKSYNKRMKSYNISITKNIINYGKKIYPSEN